ncbi:MAG: hypothetical protein KDA87_16235 [Planctomycetales bacterium]|nr:hypothetical protein [Planctomycetales bacterium]
MLCPTPYSKHRRIRRWVYCLIRIKRWLIRLGKDCAIFGNARIYADREIHVCDVREDDSTSDLR